MKYARVVVELVLVVAVAVFVYLWAQELFGKQAVGTTVIAEEAPQLKGVGAEKKECVPVIVYKEAAKKKLNLSQGVQADKSKAVTGATVVKPDIRPHTITSVVDTRTGETVIYDTRMKAPLFAVDVRGEAGVGYGYNRDGSVIRFSGRQALFDVKGLKVLGEASYDASLSGAKNGWFGGVMVLYHW